MVDIIDTAAMPWGENLAAQRSGGMAHKRLFEGQEGSPDNYLLVLALESSDYYSPRHRHAWDQVRYCLEGAVPIARGLAVEAGEVAYFPAGAPYGPQEGGPDRIELLLQFGGADGQGYIGADRLKSAREEMSSFGRFEKGVFTREQGDGRRNQDAYEAIWEHVTGRPIAYPDPAYKTPVIARPSSVPWEGAEGGVAHKKVALFPHRGLSIEFIRLASGVRHEAGTSESRRLAFITRGNGMCGDGALPAQAAIRVEPGEDFTVEAESEMELLLLSIAPVAAAWSGKALG
jgi:mannose-6-phosphate isomerase-like protein (cupin superfamily)